MINSIHIENFMGYGSFKSGILAPVNIIIGNNDTGKTALLKLLYASTKSVEMYSSKLQHQHNRISFRKILAEKLINTYQPTKKGLGELVSKLTKEKLRINIEYQHLKLGYEDRLTFSFGESTTNTINDCPDEIKQISDNFKCLFIPAKEILTSLKAIRATRDNLFMAGFDDTYLDLIKAVVIPTVKGRVKEELSSVGKKLEELFDGQIEQGKDDDFIFKKGNTEYSMQLTSEGVKKIGIFTTLIKNRQLNSNSILFLDEPETTLHPKATRELVEMLMLMAKSGIQIFIATHNYFVLKQMHLCAQKYEIATNCYMLSKEKGQKSVSVSMTDLQKDFPENAISEEAIEMADEEMRLHLGF
jgi:AAA15 family ATPase/GTPase